MKKSPHVMIAAICLAALIFAPVCVAFAGEQISAETKESVSRFDVAKANQGWVGFGPEKLWRMRPTFETSATFDSNIHREPSGRRNEDVIWHFTPGIGISREGSKLKIKSSYKMDYQVYTKNQSNHENALNHEVNNEIEYTGNKLNVKATDDFGAMKSFASSETSKRVNIRYNNLGTETKYKLTDKVSASAIYNNNVFHYAEADLRESSYITQDAGGRLYYHITDKTDIYLQGTGTNVNYYNGAPFSSNGFSILAGAIGKPVEKLILSANTGWKSRFYEKDNLNNYYNWVIEGIAKYMLTYKIGVALSAKKDVAESTYQNVGWYSVNQYGLDLDYMVTPHLKVLGGTGIQRNWYSTATTEGNENKRRVDWIYNAHLRANWNPYKFVGLSSGYTCELRNSVFGAFSYVDHQVDVALSFSI